MDCVKLCILQIQRTQERFRPIPEKNSSKRKNSGYFDTGFLGGLFLAYIPALFIRSLSPLNKKKGKAHLLKGLPF